MGACQTREIDAAVQNGVIGNVYALGINADRRHVFPTAVSPAAGSDFFIIGHNCFSYLLNYLGLR